MAYPENPQRPGFIDFEPPQGRGRKAVEARFGFLTTAPTKLERDKAKYPTQEAFEASAEYKSYEDQLHRYMAWRVYDEMVRTEMDYIKDLQVLANHKDQIKAAYAKITNKDYTDKAEVEKLLDLSEQLLNQQKNLLRSLTHDGPDAWAEQATALKKAYLEYIVQYGKLKDLPINEASATLDTQALFDIFKQPQFQGLNISDFAIKPVQRIMKYGLLIKEMQKHIPQTHPESHALAKAEQRFKDTADRINEEKRLSEQRAQAEQLVALFNQSQEKATQNFPEIINFFAKSQLSITELETLLIKPLNKAYIPAKWSAAFDEAFRADPAAKERKQALVELLTQHFLTLEPLSPSTTTQVPPLSGTTTTPKAPSADAEKSQQPREFPVTQQPTLSAGIAKATNTVTQPLMTQAPGAQPSVTPQELKSSEPISGVRVIIRGKPDKEALKIQLQNIAKEWGDNFQVVPITKHAAKEDKPGIGRRIKNFAQGREQFLLKDPQGNKLIRVNLYEDYISIKLAEDKKAAATLSADSIEKMHQINREISRVMSSAAKPEIHSTQAAAVASLQSLDANERRPIDYKLSKRTKQMIKSLYKPGIQSSQPTLTSAGAQPSSLLEIPIEYHQRTELKKMGKRMEKMYGIDSMQLESEEVKSKFVNIMQNGFVPVLHNPDIDGLASHYKKQGNFQGEIAIHARNPQVALQQYENILAAGFTPRFDPRAKAAVTAYMHAQARKDQSMQVAFSGEIRSIEISGVPDKNGELQPEQVLQRLLIAANDDLPVKLDSQATLALQHYVLEQKGMQQRFSLPTPVSIADAKNVIHFAALGLLPTENLSAQDQKSLKSYLQELSSLAAQTKIHSGHVAQDLKTLQALYALGTAMAVQNETELLRYTSQLPEPLTIDIKNLPQSEQIAQVKYLAQVGIAAQADSHLKRPDESIEIVSENAQHALQIFQTLLQQNFTPTFEAKTAERVQGWLKNTIQEISLTAEKPETLLNQIKICFKHGLVPRLTAKQEKMLKSYAQTHNITLDLVGFQGEAVRLNMSKAQQWGIFINVNKPALDAYQQERKAQAFLGAEYGVEIKPVYHNRSRGLFFRSQEVDRKKTLDLANHYLKQGVHIVLSDEINQLQALNESRKNKRWFFFFGPLTQEAKQAKQFVDGLAAITDQKQKNQHAFLSNRAETYDPTDLAASSIAHTSSHLTPMRVARATTQGKKDKSQIEQLGARQVVSSSKPKNN